MCVNGRQGCAEPAKKFGCCSACLAERMDGAVFVDQFQPGYSYRSRIVPTCVIDSVLTVSLGACETTRHVTYRAPHPKGWTVVAVDEPHEVTPERVINTCPCIHCRPFLDAPHGNGCVGYHCKGTCVSPSRAR